MKEILFLALLSIVAIAMFGWGDILASEAIEIKAMAMPANVRIVDGPQMADYSNDTRWSLQDLVDKL